jgi:benzylsuccinate CoA-transferase BbsF subunit
MDTNNSNAFSGLTIVAFSWAMVGPLTMKFFADYGATVIRVETSHRPCVTRTSAPYKGGEAGLNRSGYFNHFASNELSLSLNMGHPAGQAVARELIARADVVMENFTPGVMDRWGLGYEELRKIKPDIIMLRQNGFGLDGPYKNLAAFGMILAAIAGMPNFIGWPDRGPLPMGVGAYTDCISPRLASAALIAALDYRDRTGKGQLLDLAQFETALYFILPGVLDYAVNGREPERRGNADPYAAPHGVYPCEDDNSWCTIAVLDDAQWQRLCGILGKPECSRDSRFDTAVHRKQNEREADELVTAWTRQHTAQEVMESLQAAGIPAGVVESSAEIYADPQLRGRNAFWPLQHDEMGVFTHLGASFEMSKTRAQAYRPSPCLGEHNEYILTKILGKSDDEFVELLTSGALE